MNGAAKYVLKKLLQRYWRLTRGMTLGAQGVLIDPQGRIVLIRHTYIQGWRFPGGGVEHGETMVTALTRELREETGAEIAAEPELFGIYSNAAVFPNDHVALYIVRNWRRDRVPDPTKSQSMACLRRTICPPTSPMVPRGASRRSSPARPGLPTGEPI